MQKIPCFGGPFDGRFYTDDREPTGYTEFKFRNRTVYLWTVYLWKEINATRLDFATLERAAKKPAPPDEEVHR